MPQHERAPAPSLITTLVFGLALHAAPALAFAPDANLWLASRLPEALPAGAREPLWTTEIPRVLVDRLNEDEESPEQAAALRRFDVMHSRQGGPIPATEDSLIGLAPFELANAAQELRAALRRGNATLSARALADIARAVSDLADPFRTTRPDPSETPGARAWFSDGFAPEDVAGAPIPDWEAGDPLTIAFMLAHESAGVRQAIEMATVAQDGAAIASMRRQRLERALALGAGLVRRAWVAAGSPSAAGPSTSLRVEPNPVRGDFALLFATREAGEARFEVYDVQGRRFAEGSLGPVEAGLHRMPMDPRWLSRVPAGIYLARVAVGNGSVVGRFVRVTP